MPLPFAPKPDASRVYSSLKDKLLTEITADNFDDLKGSVYAQGTDGAEDEYRRLLLLGLAADKISLSGPLAGTDAEPTCKIIKITDTTGTGSPDGIVFQPDEEGEVWQLVSAGLGTLNANSGQLRLHDADTGQTILVGSETSGSGVMEPTGNFGGAVWVTKNLYLDYKFNTATGSCVIKVAVARVR
jgi:hypothetical protein